MAPRFCAKRMGIVDWSASPNAAPVDHRMPAPFRRQQLTPAALRAAVHLCAKGTPVDLTGARLTDDARKLAQAKMADPRSRELWSAVVRGML